MIEVLHDLAVAAVFIFQEGMVVSHSLYGRLHGYGP